MSCANRFRRIVLVSALALLFPGCTSTSFTRTGFDLPPVPPPSPCQAVVLQNPPSDRKFVELGFCITSVPGGGIITDNTPKAIAELQECACKNGGNAMVFLGDSESGFHSGFGYSQQRVKARAIVLFVFPKETQ